MTKLLDQNGPDVSEETQKLRWNSYDLAERQNVQSLAGRLDLYAEQMGELEAFRFLAPGGDEPRLTYAALRRRVRGFAAQLQGDGVKPGARVALIIEPSLEFVVAFLACQISGYTAVPLPRPKTDAARERTRLALADANCAVILSTQQTVSLWNDPPTGSFVLVDDHLSNGEPAPFSLAEETVAVLQYTSGSTGNPKAAVITNGNLVAARDAINSAADLRPTDVVLSWLPFEHDMGLIGGLLQPFWMGAQGLLMSPEQFTARPLRWLQQISRCRATVTVAPDSAYATCARLGATPAAASLDLSCLEVAFSGAEPLRPETIDGFCGAFAPVGFQRSAFLPCYGLAEATLLVAGEGRQDPPHSLAVDTTSLSQGKAVVVRDRAGRLLVSSGAPASPNLCRIVDSETQLALPEGRVGDIWVAGPTVASGYFRKPEQTDHSFARVITGEDGAFLRTGDLGFLHEGRLYVTGRSASRILRFGRTFDAADLEAAGAGAHSSLRAGRIAVLQTGEAEQIVALQEISPAEDDGAMAARALWSRIVRLTGVSVDRICLLAPGTLLWTTSGKIRRAASMTQLDLAPERMLLDWQPKQSDAALQDLMACLQAAQHPAHVIETKLCAWLAAVTGEDVEEIDPEISWSDQAVDSLKAAELVEALENSVDRALDADLLFTFPCPADLAAHLAEQLS